MSDNELRAELQKCIDAKTKPLGALGRIEHLALQIGLIQRSVSLQIEPAAIYVFAADHGAAASGVSAFPQAVTFQMVRNFLSGGAAINVFARASGMQFNVVDAGVVEPVPPHPLLLSKRIGPGTRNFLAEPAMTPRQCAQALSYGEEIATEAADKGVRVIGLGEMGIGNTSSAALLTSLATGADLRECVGRGTGLDDAGLARKTELLQSALLLHRVSADPLERLRTFGGFEIAMLAGAMVGAARRRMVILIDGFIVSAALATACELESGVLECCVFCHQSAEPGHAALLLKFAAEPLLDLSLRLGEGTGAALAYPLVKAAAAFLNEMATFESAAVSGRSQ